MVMKILENEKKRILIFPFFSEKGPFEKLLNMRFALERERLLFIYKHTYLITRALNNTTCQSKLCRLLERIVLFTHSFLPLIDCCYFYSLVPRTKLEICMDEGILKQPSYKLKSSITYMIIQFDLV